MNKSMDLTHIQNTVVVIITLMPICLGENLKLFQQFRKTLDVTQVKTVRSLTECAVMFQLDTDSSSFNYNEVDKICEFSEDYPENSLTASVDWKVYGRIVDGQWSAWTNWNTCTVTCGDGTLSRSRSCDSPAPSNGGAGCTGETTQSQACTNGPCLTASDFYISNYLSSWDAAKTTCEGLSARLVFIDSQYKLDSLKGLISAFNHWFGLRCTSGTNCVWTNGMSLEPASARWAPGQPDSRDCVWIGYYTDKWDDDFCNTQRYFICEYV